MGSSSSSINDSPLDEINKNVSELQDKLVKYYQKKEKITEETFTKLYNDKTGQSQSISCEFIGVHISNHKDKIDQLVLTLESIKKDLKPPENCL